MTTSPPAPDERPEVPAPGVDAVPAVDQADSGAAQRDGDRAEVPSDAERTGTAEDEAEAARRHP